MTTSPFVVLIHQSNLDTLFHAASVAVASAASGRATYIVLFLAALKDWMDDAEWNVRAKPLLSGTQQVPSVEFLGTSGSSPRQMLEETRPLGLKIYACSGSVELLDLSRAEVLQKVDDIIGLPALFRKIGPNASIVSY
ncbi:MAG: hypothetical protein HUU55_12815 [Myxococcales bacterium]|nr:hypothetical protein [Myxococcales bacterium]